MNSILNFIINTTFYTCVFNLASSPISATYPPTLKLSSFVGIGASASAATVIADFFANGCVVWGSGSAVQRRGVTASTTVVAGVVTLTLHAYFSSLPTAGDTVYVYPGCDGLAATCKAYNLPPGLVVEL